MSAKFRLLRQGAPAIQDLPAECDCGSKRESMLMEFTLACPLVQLAQTSSHDWGWRIIPGDCHRHFLPLAIGWAWGRTSLADAKSRAMIGGLDVMQSIYFLSVNRHASK